MGTCYKGHSKQYRSIGQNIMVVSSKFKYKNGRFGDNSPSSGNITRNIKSKNPLQTAQEFYNAISFGGKETSYKHGKVKTTQMADGSIISFRTTSTSDGTPVVEINITCSSHSAGLKQQKIHFIGE